MIFPPMSPLPSATGLSVSARRRNKIYTTCTHLSSDGERACFDGKQTEWDPLTLLCWGIGKGTAAR